MVNEKVVDFPNPFEDAPQQRAFKEATRLANLSPGEWKLWIEGSAQALGVPVATLTQSVLDILKDRDKKAKEEKAEIRRQGALADRRRIAERRRIDKEAAQKAREKAKALASIQHLPTTRTPQACHE
jgi:hypothetical protein